MSDVNLVQQARLLIKDGVYDPEQLFKIIYQSNRVHYSKVRDAIHVAKGR